MKILVINCGSSTLKFQLVAVEGEDIAPGQQRSLAFGIVDRIGGHAAIRFSSENGESLQESADVTDHSDAARRVLGWLRSLGLIGHDRLDAVGHRVVHGGDRFVEATLIDDQTMDAIEDLSRLAPLHNEPSLEAIHAVGRLLGPDVPQVAIFDTAFHRTLPTRASMYAIPLELAEKHGIRRYGFHGLAHRYMTERYGAITGTPIDTIKLITVQLGNGCSATAVDGGRAVDTSMGFTPLEGLMMGTRSGDVDPSLAGFLARKEGVDIDEVEDWLNTRSGLLGVSGSSQDMRELLEAERQGNDRAALAVEMFCYRVRKCIGAYLAALGGARALVFGGGIGENSPQVRARICEDMEWCGLILDEERNTQAIGVERRISAEHSRIHAYVIPVDEGMIIACDTLRCLRGQQQGD